MILFPSFTYFVILAGIVFIYWRLQFRKQNALLFVASYALYATWSVPFLSLILASSFVGYFCGRRIHQAGSASSRKRFFWAAIAWNVGILCLFKYYNFFESSVLSGLMKFGIDASGWHLNVLLPLGISFYTFQILSYVIDIYRKKLAPTDSFLNFSVFVAFFPHLIAGPIQRPSLLLAQIESPRSFDSRQFWRGIDLIMWALLKKIVIANGIGQYVGIIFALKQPTLLILLVGGVGFALQLFADFSAYTDFARGSSKLMGIELSKNFDKPFLARNPSDFWSRWHISLSSWFKDYVYFPLVFKFRRLPHFIAYPPVILLTWLLIGVWHGEGWRYAVWGLYYGVLIILYQFALKPIIAPVWKENFFTRFLAIASTMACVAVGFTIFRVDFSLPLLSIVKDSLFGNFFADSKVAIIMSVLYFIYCIPLLINLAYGAYLRRQPIDIHIWYGARAFSYAIIILALVIFGGTPQYEFIYFQF